jgi:hypothetical protein
MLILTIICLHLDSPSWVGPGCFLTNIQVPCFLRQYGADYDD